MDKSYPQHGHHHHPLSFIATGTPYHSYLSYYGPSSAPAGQGGSRDAGGGVPTGTAMPTRSSANTSNTSSPLSSGYHRPLYRSAYQQLSPTYLPYKHYNSNYFSHLSPHHQLHHKEYLNYGDRSGRGGNSKLQHLSNRLHGWKSVSIVSHGKGVPYNTPPVELTNTKTARWITILAMPTVVGTIQLEGINSLGAPMETIATCNTSTSEPTHQPWPVVGIVSAIRWTFNGIHRTFQSFSLTSGQSDICNCNIVLWQTDRLLIDHNHLT